MTVLKQSRFTKHYHVMPAKTLVYKSMVAMPALLVMGLGAKSRMEFDPFEFVAPTPKQNAAILAYKDVVHDSAALTIDPTDQANVIRTRQVAMEWIGGARRGTLVPLSPVSYDDNSRDGIKSEISQRNQAVTSTLLYAANQENVRGKYTQAVFDALTAIRVTQVIKYSDYSTIMQSSLYERRSLRMIDVALPHLSAHDQAETRSALIALTPKGDKLQQIAELERFMFIEYLRRMDTDPKRIASIAPFQAQPAVLPTSQFRGALLASAKDDTLPAAQQVDWLAREGEEDVARMYKSLTTTHK